jgi:hypothetical protein
MSEASAPRIRAWSCPVRAVFGIELFSGKLNGRNALLGTAIPNNRR